MLPGFPLFDINIASTIVVEEKNIFVQARSAEVSTGTSLRASSLFGSHARFILGASGERPREDWGGAS